MSRRKSEIDLSISEAVSAPGTNVGPTSVQNKVVGQYHTRQCKTNCMPEASTARAVGQQSTTYVV
eukprot:3520974-Rhodomonas_salina.1